MAYSPSDSRRRRVLVYTSQAIPPQHRFIEYPLRNLTQWEPVLLCASRAIDTVSLDGLDVICLDPPWPRSFHWAIRRARGLLGVAGSRDVRKIKSLRGSLLHAHWGTSGVLVAPLAKAAGLPLLVTLHGFDIQSKDNFWTSGQGGWWHRDYPDRLRKIAADGAHFVAVSRAIFKLAIQRGLPESHVHYAPIGIDTTAFRPSGIPMSERPPKILFVANHIERKGGATLIRAFASVRKHINNAHLVMVGDGPEREKWSSLASSLGLAVDFRGRLSPQAVQAEMRDAVVFCLPATRLPHHDLAEGFGLVVVEAAASGVPVVTSAQGLESEGVHHEKTGFAIQDGDEQILAEHIISLLADRALAQRLGDAGPEFVRRNFDVTVCTRALEDLYDRVAECGVSPESRRATSA